MDKGILSEYEKITKVITSSSESFKAFLKYSARIYKYPFDTALIAYSQCPKATMLATYNIWNKVGRHVNRGERSITVEILADKYLNKKIHLFDVSQTSGNTLPYLWVLNSDNRTQLLNKLNDGIENKYDSIEDYIKAEINAGLHVGYHDLGDRKLTELIYQSTLLTVNSRCGLDISKISDQPFEYLGELNDMESVWAVCREVNSISHNVLKNMETEIKALNKERGNINGRDEQELGRTDTQPSLYREGRNQVVTASQTEGQQTTQSLGPASSSLYAGNRPDKGDDTQYERRVNADTPQSREGSGETIHSDSGRDGGKEPSTKGLHEKSSALQLDSGNSERNSPRGSGKRTSLTTENIDTSKELPKDSSFIMPKTEKGKSTALPHYDREHEDKSLPFFGNEYTISEILLTTPHIKASIDEIRVFYETHSNNNERTEYIKSIFNNDYTELLIGKNNDYRVGYKTYDNVLHLWEGSYLSRTAQSFFDWRVIAKYYEGMRVMGKLHNSVTPISSIDGQISLLDTNTEKIVFSQELVDAVITDGSGISGGKFRIYQQFQKHSSETDNVNFLKKEYGYGGCGPVIIGTGIDETHSEKGITLSKGYDVNAPKITLRWNYVEKRIKQLIYNDCYLSEEEKLIYPKWLSQEGHKLKSIVLDYANSKKQKTINTSTDSKKSDKSEPTIEQLSFESLINNPEAIISKPVVAVEPKADEVVKLSNYHNTSDESELLYRGNVTEKFRANIDAVKTLKKIESEQRQATSAEQKTLSKYLGWGGLANAFDPNKSSWDKEYAELKALLSPSEYEAARASTVTAFFTEPQIIREIYNGLESYGFHGGKILDPAMGTGNFFSVLPESMKESELHGVELDELTGRIAKQLYPNADIKIQGFEKTAFDDNSFDLVVGNVPFNDFKVYDERYNSQNFLIHDFFFAKSLDKVREGGIVAFITSKGTMDKKDSKVREYIANRADLIGAVRLPETAFKSVGTKAVSDIIFLQKRNTPPKELPNWVNVAETKDKEGNTVSVNQYFIDNKDMILGNLKQVSGPYGPTTTVIAKENSDLSHELHNVLITFDGHYVPKTEKSPARANRQEKKPENPKVFEGNIESIRNFTYTSVENSIFYRENDDVSYINASGTKKSKMLGLIGIRDSVRKVIDIQVTPYEPETLTAAQKELNEQYDSFVKKYGYINEKANYSLLENDDDLPLFRSIEEYNQDEKRYDKAPIFNKATIRSYKQPDKAETALEALVISMNTKLCVDIQYMSQLYGKEPTEIINELGNKIFLNPQKYDGNILSGWETADEYLSGNVKDKFAFATIKAEEHPELFSRNVEALKSVQPKPLTPSEIDFRIGSPWIPIEYYKEFMYKTFGTPSYLRFSIFPAIDIQYLKFTTEWRISGKHADSGSVKVNRTFGTERFNAYMIYEDCLNLKSTTVRDPVRYYDDNGAERTKYVVNVKETMIARAKQQQIKEAFNTWLFADKERADTLVKIYNDKFNNIRPREYDGSTLTFRNMAKEYDLRHHQRNAVARILNSGTALVAHEVGAGKTATMIAAGMTLRQCGAVKKPVYVVPNPLVEQWEHEFLRFYPTAHLLVATKKDFQKENRRRFFGRIAVGDYDGIIIPQSSFEKIPISPQRQMDLIDSEIADIEEMISQAKDEKSENWTVKQMELQKKKLQERYHRLSGESKKDSLLYFEQLGIDFMFVDEAHAYKNYSTYTKMTNVAGINKTSSQRAFDMLMKCQYLQEKNNGRGVVFATGTPISNSMSEMFVMQKYLQPEKLKEAGVDMFDNWAATFGEVVTSLEITPEGTGYRMKSRFAKFHNLPELMSMFKEVADIETADMLNLPRPLIEGGKPKVISTECSEYQQRKVLEFADRAEAIRKGAVKPNEDNMLKLTLEAKLLSIDPRLLDPHAPNDSGSKLSRCTDNVYKIYKDTEEKKLTQIIFCDVGIPKGDGKFNVYDEIKNQLTAMGIPKEEIAFIHDCKTDEQRSALFEKVRNGDVRVILGSTSKLGTGTNIQDRLIAAHHIDCPWRPSDITQRNGRILRPGNINKTVKIFNYVTVGTFDAYLWQIQEQKLRYISQVMTGKSIMRSCEDCDETVLTAAEVKAIATNNPLVSEKMETDNEVMRLKILKSNWENEIVSLKTDINKTIPETIIAEKGRISRLQKDIKVAEKNKQSEFSITVGSETFDKRTDAGDRILMYSKTLGKEPGDKIEIGEFNGFKLGLKRDAFGDIEIALIGNNTYTTELSQYNAGNIIKLENIIEKLPNELKSEQQKLEQSINRLEDAKSAVTKPFTEESKLNAMLAKQAEIETKLEFGKAKQQDVVGEDTKQEDKKSYTQEDLFNAISNKDVDTVKSIISSDNGLMQELYEGDTPLHTAVKAGSVDCVNEILKSGIYANVLNAHRNTPLYYAVRDDNVDIAKSLLEAGASPELKTERGTKVSEFATSSKMKSLMYQYSQSEDQSKAISRHC